MPSKKREAQEANCQDATQIVKKQKQGKGDLEEIEFNFAEDLCYKTISASLMQSSDNNTIIQYFEKIKLLVPSACKIPVGLDCEWCPPWFRKVDQPEERICTMQFYNPKVGALVLSTVGVKVLPKYLIDFFANPNILKVGVNIIGDGGRIKRDFKTTVNGLLNLEKLTNAAGRMSMEKLIAIHCPKKFHINKDSVENKVRLGDWSKFPLDKLQLKYASIDAVLSFVIFLFQNKMKWKDRETFVVKDDDKFNGNIQSVEYDHLKDDISSEIDQTTLRKKKSLSDKANSNFFIMHRNRSIVPPNLQTKDHPVGTKDCLKGFVVVASGVLDSFSRKDFAEYVQKHGGKVSKSITNSTSFLVNDHGTVGPSKLKKCQVKGIPVVGEDHILDIVRKSSLEIIDSCSSEKP